MPRGCASRFRADAPRTSRKQTTIRRRPITRAIITLFSTSPMRIPAIALTLALLISTTAVGQNYSYGVCAIDLDAPTADKTAELGTGLVRLAYTWDVIEGDCKGCYNWTHADRWRDEAR